MRAGGTTLCLLVLALSTPAACQRPPGSEEAGVQAAAGVEEIITREMVDAHIRYLSSDELMGRDAFRPEIRRAEDYIARQYREMGLEAFPAHPGYRDVFTFEYRPRNAPGAEPTPYELTNVVGYLEGTDPKLKHEYILFGAHHDHVGVHQPRDPPPPGTPIDSIYNGADDNAAGTTAVLALAEYYARTGTNRRSLIFATFTAEEKGILGSRHLAGDLPVDSSQLVCMVNFEMIGKPAADGDFELMILGPERSNLDEIFRAALPEESPVELVDPREHQVRYFFGSDNVAFHRAGFISTTLASPFSTDDPDYHRPTDEYGLLDLDYMTSVIRAAAAMAEPLVSGDATPERTEAVGTGGG